MNVLKKQKKEKVNFVDFTAFGVSQNCPPAYKNMIKEILTQSKNAVTDKELVRKLAQQFHLIPEDLHSKVKKTINELIIDGDIARRKYKGKYFYKLKVEKSQKSVKKIVPAAEIKKRNLTDFYKIENVGVEDPRKLVLDYLNQKKLNKIPQGINSPNQACENVGTLKPDVGAWARQFHTSSLDANGQETNKKVPTVSAKSTQKKSKNQKIPFHSGSLEVFNKHSATMKRKNKPQRRKREQRKTKNKAKNCSSTARGRSGLKKKLDSSRRKKEPTRKKQKKKLEERGNETDDRNTPGHSKKESLEKERSFSKRKYLKKISSESYGTEDTKEFRKVTIKETDFFR